MITLAGQLPKSLILLVQLLLHAVYHQFLGLLNLFKLFLMSLWGTERVVLGIFGLLGRQLIPEKHLGQIHVIVVLISQLLKTLLELGSLYLLLFEIEVKLFGFDLCLAVFIYTSIMCLLLLSPSECCLLGYFQVDVLYGSLRLTVTLDALLLVFLELH
jgi:hypothetical protein